MIRSCLYRFVQLIGVFWISLIPILLSTLVIRFWFSRDIGEFLVVFCIGMIVAMLGIFRLAYREGYKKKRVERRSCVEWISALALQMLISIPLGFRVYIAGPTSNLSKIFIVLFNISIDVYDEIPLLVHILAQSVCNCFYIPIFIVAQIMGKRNREKDTSILIKSNREKD